ncbi:MAG: hypothetical protein H7X95_12630 [Deltaproteobacteria bacterium]|nr:hypothetical protein [Deltaproteobacteria bacterium]
MMYRSRFSVVLFGVLVLGPFGTAVAQGPQGPGGATPLPLAIDLKKVPVGSWSEYRIADGQNTMVVRMALVSRTGQLAYLETEIKGGPVAALGRTTMRMAVPLEDAAEVKPKEQVIQLGDNPPMILPAEMSGGKSQSFRKLDPKKRVGVDNVTVPGGAFPKADHYQDKGAAGETIDFWISKSVLPFGLIKVSSTGAPGGKAVTMELTGKGADAKPVITKTPQPFDAASIMKQAQPAMGASKGPHGAAGPHGAGDSHGPGGPHGAGGPPPRAIPSPQQGMPGTLPGAPSAPPAKDTKK